MVTRRDGGGTHVVYTLERPVLDRAGHAGRTDPAVRGAWPNTTRTCLKRTPVMWASCRTTRWQGRTGAASIRTGGAPNLTGSPSWQRLSRSVGESRKSQGLPRAGRQGCFLAVMQFAGKPEHAEHDLLAVTIATNQSNCPPLELSHVRSVAKSVTRYRARWIAEGAYYTPEQHNAMGASATTARCLESATATRARRKGRGDHPGGRAWRVYAKR